MEFPTYPEYESTQISWLPKYPANWEVRRLKFMSSIQNGFDYKHVELDQSEDGYPVYGSGGKFRKASAYLYDGESILYGRKGTIDKPLYVKGKFWTVDTMFYSEIDQSVFGRFMYYSALTIQYQYLATQTALPSITQYDLSNYWLCYPSYNEQTQIAQFLDYKTAQIDQLIEKKKNLIEKLNEQRIAVITQAVTKGLNPDTPMKDSQVDWLGEVPEHWEVVKFKYYVGFQEGPGIMAVDFRDEGVPLIRIRNVQNEYVDLNGCNFLDPKKVEKTWGHFKCQLGDLIISGSASTGLISEISKDNVGAIVYTGLIRLWKLANISKEFIRWYVSSNTFFSQVNRFKTGSTIQHFGPEHLRQMLICLPPKSEQDFIVNHLEKETKKIDNMLKINNKTIDRLNEYRTALITAAVTGKIDVRDIDIPQPEAALC